MSAVDDDLKRLVQEIAEKRDAEQNERERVSAERIGRLRSAGMSDDQIRASAALMQELLDEQAALMQKEWDRQVARLAGKLKRQGIA